MMGADPLAQLQPLREPAAIGWWPPAPGWWVLAALAALALFFATRWWLARRRRNAYRRQGIAALQHIQQQWQQTGDNLDCLTRTNALLKAVALRAFPQRDVAAATGDTWLTLLNSRITDAQQFNLNMLEAQYRGDIATDELEQHLGRVAYWIKRHRGDA